MIAIRQATWRQRAIPLALMVLIGLSRLYCQVHWPEDVVGGLVIGGMVVVAYLVVAGAWQTSGLQLEPWRTAWLMIIVVAAMSLLGGHIETCVQSAGALLGAGLGYALLETRGGYKARAPLPTQVLKVVVALAALFGVRAGSKMVLGSMPGATYIRYAMIGFTCTYLLPMIFAGFHNWRLRARKAMDEVSEGVGEEP